MSINNKNINPIEQYAISIRYGILLTSITLERATSIYLAGLLGINDYKNTKSFGNKSGNLSFNQKIELLTDLDAIKKDDKKKFLAFMEIRNQFIHNIDINSFTECFRTLEGKENYLLKLFPQDTSKSKETQLMLATENLGLHLMDLINELPEKMFVREIDKIKIEIYTLMKEKYIDKIINMRVILEKKITPKVHLKNGLTNEELEYLNLEIKNNFEGVF